MAQVTKYSGPSGKGAGGALLNEMRENSRTNEGVRVDIAAGDFLAWRNSSLLILTAGTTPIIEVSTNEGRIRWAASDSAAIFTVCKVPGNFSDVHKELVYIGKFLETGGTDTIVVTMTIYARAAGGALKGPFTATATLTKSGTNPQELIFDFAEQAASLLYILPDDELTVSITPSAHTTDALTFYGGQFRLRENAALTNANDRVKAYS